MSTYVSRVAGTGSEKGVGGGSGWGPGENDPHRLPRAMTVATPGRAGALGPPASLGLYPWTMKCGVKQPKFCV